MTLSTPDLTALIGSRICHDLISPLGAIGNGVELLSMNVNPESPEMGLIMESVGNANARIRFFRIAFGAAEKSQTLGFNEVSGILDDIGAAGRVSYDWQSITDQPRLDVKLAFLVLQCLESAMPWGGRITVAVVGSQWAITGIAGKLNIKTDLWQILSGGPDLPDLNAADVHFALSPIAANDAGRKISFETSATEIRVRF